MIEETGQVIAVDGAWAIVATQRRSGCGHCASNKGNSQCQTAAITRMFAPQQPQLRVLNLIQASVGDQVVLGITANNLLLATALLYGLPLLALIGGILVGQWWSLRNMELAMGLAMELPMELPSLLGGLFGLSAGFGLARYYTNKAELGAKCQILRLSTARVITPLIDSLIAPHLANQGNNEQLVVGVKQRNSLPSKH